MGQVRYLLGGSPIKWNWNCFPEPVRPKLDHRTKKRLKALKKDKKSCKKIKANAD